MTNVKDNTENAGRLFFDDLGGFLPVPVYAPDDGAGSGGDSNDAAGGGGADAEGAQGDGTAKSGDEGNKEDHKEHLDKPEEDLYGKPEDKAEKDEKSDEADKKDDGKNDDKKEEDKEEDKKEVDLKAVPGEKEEYQLTLPKGVEVNKPLLDSISPMLKAKGFSHAETQELANKVVEDAARAEKEQQEEWGKTVDGWKETVEKDPEIGGDKFKASSVAAKGVIDKFGNDSLKEFLSTSGVGNHPELVRMCVKISGVLGEDDIPTDEGGGTPKKGSSVEDTAEELYGGTTPSTQNG